MRLGPCECGRGEKEAGKGRCRECRLDSLSKAREVSIGQRRLVRATLNAVMEQLKDPERGLKSITDEQLAQIHLGEIIAKGPGAAAQAMTQLLVLREKGWKKVAEENRALVHELTRKLRDYETKVDALEKRWTKELAKAKREVERATRAEITKTVRAEAEMKARVQAGVDRLAPASGGDAHAPGAGVHGEGTGNGVEVSDREVEG
jgi:hypothetical protein